MLVAATGLEPVLPKAGMQILSLLCLPFHHAARRKRSSTACAHVSRLPHFFHVRIWVDLGAPELAQAPL
jgi:hypothetical protein